MFCCLNYSFTCAHSCHSIPSAILWSLNRSIHRTYTPVKLCCNDTLTITALEPHSPSFQSSTQFHLIPAVTRIDLNLISQSPSSGTLACVTALAEALTDHKLISLRFIDRVCDEPYAANLGKLVQWLQFTWIQTQADASASQVNRPLITLTDLSICVADERDSHERYESPIEWLDMNSLLFSNTLTTINLDLQHGWDRPDERFHLIGALPSSLTSVTLKLGTNDLHLDEQFDWQLLFARCDWLPNVRRLDLGTAVFTHPSLSTITTTGLARPYENLRLVWADDSLRLDQFEHVTEFVLTVSVEVLSHLLDVLSSIDAMPQLKSFRLNCGGPVMPDANRDVIHRDLSPLFIFLSKRPVQSIDLNIDCDDVIWIPLSESAMRSLANLKSMTDFHYEVAPDLDPHTAPFETEELGKFQSVGSWPSLESLTLCGVSPVDELTTLVRASPALRELKFAPYDTEARSALWSVHTLELIDRHCPSIQKIEFNMAAKFLSFCEADYRSAAHIQLSLHHLESLAFPFAVIDDKGLHFLLSKICHAHITYFEQGWPHGNLSKLRTMLHHVLRSLTKLAMPSFSGTNVFPEFLTFQRVYAHFPKGFPLLREQDYRWQYSFSPLRNEHGQNGREAFFAMLGKVLLQDELDTLTRWNRGDYSENAEITSYIAMVE